MTSKAGEEVTKASIRKEIWDHIEKEDLANFPRPVHHRIPNFKGAAEAGDRAAGLDVFKDSQTVKINPDKPQEQCRFRTLELHKTLLVPTPRLRSGLFNKISPPPAANKDTLRICATAQDQKTLLVSTPRRKTGLFSEIEPPEDADAEKFKICSTAQGVREYSSPIGLEDKVKIDLVIVGSVAVSEKGWRVGKGEGFADLEYAMMASMGAVDENTVIVTTVHDCQVTDIPDTLIENHDIVVDYIVTPTKVIECEHRKKPSGIIWSKITREKLQQVPILKKLRKMEEEAGKDVTIREDKTEGENGELDEGGDKKERRRGGGGGRDRGESGGESRNRRGYFRQRERRGRGTRSSKDSESAGDGLDGEGKSSNPDSPSGEDRPPRRRPRRPRRRSGRTSEGGDGGGEGEDKENFEGDSRSGRRRPPRRFNNNRRRRQGSDGVDDAGDSEGREEGSPRQGGGGRRRPRRQRPRRSRGESDGEDRKDRSSGDEDDMNEGRRRPRGGRRRIDDNTASIFVGGLPRSVRVSEFKGKVRERGVQPLRVVWRGGNGHAFLVIENKDDADGVVKALQGLSINDKDLRIELSNRSAGREDDHQDLSGQVD